MARSMFDALTDEEKRGTRANPGTASPLGPTLSMKTGAFLHPLLQAAKDKFPKDNPRGRWLGEMLLGDSPERTGRVAEGQPDQYFHYNRGSGSNVSPEIADLAGALPIGSAFKLAKLAAPLAVPAAMATGAAALNRLKASGYAATSTDDIGAALLGQSLQNTGRLDNAMVDRASPFGSPSEELAELTGGDSRTAIPDELVAQSPEPSVDEFIGKLLDEGSGQTGVEAEGASTNKLPRGRGKALKDEQIKAKKAESLLEKWREMSPAQQAAHAASMPKAQGKTPTVDRMKFKYEDDAKQARKNVQGIENLRTVRPTVANPLRAAYPGIYKNPSRLAAEANRMVAPEDPSLKDLFGVTRDDLYGMLQDRVGGQAQTIKRPKTGRIPTSPQLESIMSEANTNRLLEGISTARREAPALIEGMAPWYIMDPMYWRQVELVGEEEATRLFNQMSTLTGMSSPGSGVDAELHRGTAANYLAEKGRFSDFVDKVGIPFDKRGPDFPSDIIDVPGHAYHATAHTKPMLKYLEPEYHGDRKVEMGSVKVPSYIEAGGVPNVPEIPFQTKTPVGDAHWARGIGLADVRGGGDWGKSISGPELRGLEDWWQKDIAEPSGFEAVPAQAINWGLYAPQTGVETRIGAGKLELLARRIMDKAKRTGENPYDLRDRVLKGQAFATAAGAGVLGAGSILNETEVQALDWLLEDMENET